MSIKSGDLVKYKSAAAASSAVRISSAIDTAYYKFKWTWQQCADNLIGLVTKIEDDKIFIHWFYLGETIWEYKKCLKVIE